MTRHQKGEEKKACVCEESDCPPTLRSLIPLQIAQEGDFFLSKSELPGGGAHFRKSIERGGTILQHTPKASLLSKRALKKFIENQKFFFPGWGEIFRGSGHRHAKGG